MTAELKFSLEHERAIAFKKEYARKNDVLGHGWKYVAKHPTEEIYYVCACGEMNFIENHLLRSSSLEAIDAYIKEKGYTYMVPRNIDKNGLIDFKIEW
ncbi:TPA: hypothetical protein QCP61_004879 [Bacillus cereus]|uniref:hypothetical protein n=1 Tax=Bacillus sp. HBCD-sjtu TaxID=2053832 RepID=UPI000C331AA0|nr:hypothetical protein [Bacillus sp. HBCD-sjtu]AUD24116.1 hypothetical protein CU648_17335 [Bacillus sp. HBCD-sjtu]HDR4392746.1 hypothetical protein [Bacillus cereus]